MESQLLFHCLSLSAETVIRRPLATGASFILAKPRWSDGMNVAEAELL